MANGITLLGLGPGKPTQLTQEALQHLNGLNELYLRTKEHPIVSTLPTGIALHSFEKLYENAEKIEDVGEQIIQQVLTLGTRPGGVTYAVPGSPFIGDTTCPGIFRQAKKQGIPVRVIEGISFIEPVCAALGVDTYPRLVIVDALELATMHHVNFPPSFPAVIAQVHSRQVAVELKKVLHTVYPDEHPVTLVHSAGNPNEILELIQLSEIDRSPHLGLLTVLYIPPLAADTSFEDFQDVVAHLRAPEGCPWDREQTHVSLRKALLEETYEALKAIDEGNPRKLAEELGDLLLQIVLHAQIGFENGNFSMVEVLRGINQKIVHRHPHVFGDVELRDMDHLLTNWEKLKAKERKENGETETGLLDGVPDILPALEQAQEVQARAARVGFDWKDVQGVLDKIREEIGEIESAGNQEELTSEIGDLLFAVVNYARWRKVDAEFALRDTITRFRTRFSYIEGKARGQGREVSQMTFEELDDAWEEAKRF
ncbi:MAG: nucleoside triphosphate pyrophosphohydrolase [Anaerolinea sp.]|nr:nucleoside triphosphate pyrophosphohydrolase [Anaerolinea sp.]